MTQSEAIPLSRLDAGRKARVLALRGGREFQHRMASMGLRIGADLTVMQHQSSEGEGGAVVVKTGDTRLMIGQGMACKIIVKENVE